jgi:hypothetical protein
MLTRRKASRHPLLSTFHKAKIAFMAAGFVALVLSVSLWFTGNEQEGISAGPWVPAIHSLETLIPTGEEDL